MPTCGQGGHDLSRVHDDRALPSLTGIRFLAALAVVAGHYRSARLVQFPPWVFNLFDGRDAVALFFVLSGFVLTYNYAHLRSRSESVDFWVARFARLYPTVLLAFVLGVIGAIYALDHALALLNWYSLHRAIAPPAIAVSGLAQLTMTVGWFPFAHINQPINSPAWSIACEVFFYALFPWLIVRLRRCTGRQLVAIAAASAAAEAIFLTVLHYGAPASVRDFLVIQWPPSHLYDFVLGIVTALLFMHGGREWLAAGRPRRPLLIAIATLGLIALGLTNPIYPMYEPMIPLFAVLLFALAGDSDARLLGNSPMLLLGEASYALYMIHTPVMHLLQAAHASPLLNWWGLAATVLLSVAVFRFYETPARRWIRSRHHARVQPKPERANA